MKLIRIFLLCAVASALPTQATEPECAAPPCSHHAMLRERAITFAESLIESGYKDIKIGQIPEGWEIKQLEEIAIFANGKAHEQNVNEKGEYIIVNSKFISTEGKT